MHNLPLHFLHGLPGRWSFGLSTLCQAHGKLPVTLCVLALSAVCVTSVAAVQMGMSGVNKQILFITGLHAGEAICELHQHILVHKCIWL